MDGGSGTLELTIHMTGITRASDLTRSDFVFV
jgi:hypothetical protein